MNNEQLIYRIAVAIITARRLRHAISLNGNRYDGSLVPNLTSVTNVFVIPFELVQDATRAHPEYEPPAEMLDGLRNALSEPNA